jgi:hypothetical protein
MDLYTAAREDLKTKTFDQLHAWLPTDNTGLVAEEITRRGEAARQAWTR